MPFTYNHWPVSHQKTLHPKKGIHLGSLDIHLDQANRPEIVHGGQPV
jgi:hypothetical protein